MSESVIGITRHFSNLIRNGRTLRNIHDHTMDEVGNELLEEIEKKERGLPPGKDGIVGEAMDGILCLLDIIFQENPYISEAELEAIALDKCEKWARIYSESPTGTKVQKAG